MKKRIIALLFAAVLLCTTLSLTAFAEKIFEINGVQVSETSVEWPGEKGCWQYANDLYCYIWGVRFDQSFSGDGTNGSNLLKNLDDEERRIIPEHTETFVKSAVPGAVMRLTNARQEDESFYSDGLQEDGTYGHNVVIAAIYDEGFEGFESLGTGRRLKFYTWDSFCKAWGQGDNPAGSRYTYFKYLKWPGAPALTLQAPMEQEENWTWFLVLTIGGALGICLSAWLSSRKGKKGAQGARPSAVWLKATVLIAPFLLGLFFAWGSAVISLSLLLYLLAVFGKTGQLRVEKTAATVGVLLIPLLYALTSLWAAEKGMAIYGMILFLPIPLLLLALRQSPDEVRTDILHLVPYIGAVMTGLSLILMWIPALHGFFTIDDRLAGFYQYPNTYALFLGVGLLLLTYDRRSKLWLRLAAGAVLLAGLLLSGSRTAFLLTALAAIARALTAGKKTRLIALIAVLAGAGLAVGAAALLPSTAIRRLLTISTESSTLNGRLLYYSDALPVIAAHPFGLGYQGYYWAQGSFQHGVYSVMYVHNDVLQWLMDLGWLPGLGLTALYGMQLFRRGVPAQQRLLLGMILLHSLLDFNLQFAFTGMLVILCCAPKEGAGAWIIRRRIWLCSAAALLGGLCLSLGAASFAGTYLSSELTLALYPNDTQALMQELVKPDADMSNIAERILRLDEHAAIAHDALAAKAFEAGDVETMIEQKQLAVENARYVKEEYQDYFDKLETVIVLYLRQDSVSSAEYCAGVLRQIPEQIEQVLQTTSPLAWRITDKPDLALGEEQLAFLAQLDAVMNQDGTIGEDVTSPGNN